LADSNVGANSKSTDPTKKYDFGNSLDNFFY